VPHDGDADGVVDWRANYANLTYSLVTVPEAMRAAVSNLMYGLRLRFAALDFGVPPNGEPVFFEINPNGQWAWLQEHVGLDIAHTIADALTVDERVAAHKSRTPASPVTATSSTSGGHLRPV